MQSSRRLSVPLIRCVGRRSSFSQAAECRSSLNPPTSTIGSGRRNSLPGSSYVTAASSPCVNQNSSNSSHCSPSASPRPSPVPSPALDRKSLFSPHLKPFDVAWNRATSFGRKAAAFPSEIIWLGGAPGAGKGTNSQAIVESRGYSAKTIVMSSLLTSPACEVIKSMGGMVDDSTALELLLVELMKPEYKDGVVVDGFPRSTCQIEYIHQLEEKLSSHHLPSNFLFFMLNVSEATSVSRQLSRGIFTREANEERLKNGLPLFEQRSTDLSEDFARHRYKLFEAQLSSLTSSVGHHPLAVINAEGSPEEVKKLLRSTLARYPSPCIEQTLAPIFEESEARNPQQQSSWFNFDWKDLLPEIRIA